jgi:hypothetical protein
MLPLFEKRGHTKRFCEDAENGLDDMTFGHLIFELFLDNAEKLIHRPF